MIAASGFSRTSTILILAACLAASTASITAHDRITTKVTWDRDISRIVEARCVGCHVAGGPAPMALTSYAEARPWARAIKEEVLARRMPKWHAARGYGQFANDPSLSPFEIALIAAWADGGAPERIVQPGRDGAAQPSGRPESLPRAHDEATPGGRDAELPCGDQPLSGSLIAIRPTLDKGASAGIAALLPDGRREIVAWIRGYEPAFPTTYRLRTPLELPAGSRLQVEAAGTCTIAVTLAR